MRESTSSPKPVCGLSREATARSRGQIDEHADQGRRSHVDRHGEREGARIARFEVDQPAVGDHRGAPKSVLAQQTRQAAEEIQVGLHRADRASKPRQVGHVVAAVRHRQLDELLAKRRVHHGRGLGLRPGEDLVLRRQKRRRGDLHRHRPLDRGLARQTKALGQLARREDSPLGIHGVAHPLAHHHPALAAGPFPAARRVEGQSRSGRGFQQSGPPQHVDGPAQGLKDDGRFGIAH
ncbi:MAG: hypothetical protein NUV77_16510 [Thermoguttaceae bacterium]|nr:hypothetical protein [Thermoguttaceae bacterium]